MVQFTQAELQVLLWIQEHLRNTFLDPFIVFVTKLGNTGMIWIVISVALLLFKRTRRWGILCAASLLLGFLVTNVTLKNIVQRIRPYDVMDALKTLVPPEHDASFPSGHATSSLAVGWMLFRTARGRGGIWALVLALMISLSRLYVGVHYPSDVLVGVLIGMGAAEAVLKIKNWLVNTGRLQDDGKALCRGTGQTKQ